MIYNRILLIMDGEDEGIEKLIELAKVLDSELTLLHIVDPASMYSIPGGVNIQKILEEMKAKAEESIKEVLDRARSQGLDKVKHAVVIGSPNDEILRLSIGHDLIVLSKKDPRIVDKILKRSEVSVMVL